MDILVRIILIIISGISIPYIVVLYSEDIKNKNDIKNIEDFKKLTILSKIKILCYCIFVANWFIIAPSILFIDCFKYIFTK